MRDRCSRQTADFAHNPRSIRTAEAMPFSSLIPADGAFLIRLIPIVI